MASRIPIKFNKIFINNKWVPSISGKTFQTIDPSNKQVIADIAEGDHADVQVAVAAAKKAFEFGSEWRTMDASHRGILLNKLADKIDENREELATLEAMDNGKHFNDAFHIDLPFTAKTYRYYAGWADKHHGKTIPMEGNYMCYTKHEPVGVVGQIIPWNFPLLMQAWKLGPALAMGNTVVMKPAEQTSLSALFVADLIREVGFPEGVVNMVPGFGPTAGSAITTHLDVDKVAFTGSTEVGQIVAKEAAASNLKRVTLELGGKSPAIVFPDADMNKAIEALDFGLFFNGGQCCCASSRIYVHDDIYDEFVQKMTERAKAKMVSDQFSDLNQAPTAIQGPQVDEDQHNKIIELINSGIAEGATLNCGGGAGSDQGYFIQPTVFSDVKDDMRIAKEEIFGPVMQIMRFNDTADVLARANDSSYGLAAAVFTQDINTMHHAADALRAGTVWVNCYDNFDLAAPFGGFKMSGQGREKSEYALELYSEVKAVTIAIDQKNS